MSSPGVQHSRPHLIDADWRALAGVVTSEQIAQGQTVERFEGLVAAHSGARGAVAAASGTGALVLTLAAMGVGAGDEVVVPTYVCRSVAAAVRAVGATPVLCDVGRDWCMTAAAVRSRVTARTRAVVVVHTFGIAAPIGEIASLGVPVIEDACQSFGLEIDGRRASPLAAASFLSFHATKLLTTGEGGMVVSHDAAMLASLRSAAMKRCYGGPMSDLQAALGISQLQRLGEFLARRQVIATRYFAALCDLDVELPEHVRERSIFFRFPLTMPHDFQEFRDRFAAEGVQVRRGVDALLHDDDDPAGSHPGAERCFASTLSIPIYPAMTERDVDTVITASTRVFSRRASHGRA